MLQVPPLWLFNPGIYDLLTEYPDVVSSKGFFTTDPKHLVHHTVPTLPGTPAFTKAKKLESARKEFAAMESAGIIQRSSSPWVSP